VRSQKMVEKTEETAGSLMKLENETHEDIGHHVQPCIILSADSENSPQSMVKDISVENKSLENIPKEVPGKRDYQRNTSPTGRSLRSFRGSPGLINTRVNHGWTPSTDASTPCATLQVLTKIWKKQELHLTKFEGFKTFDIFEAERRKKIQVARRAANRRVAPEAVIINAPVPQNDPNTVSMPKDAGKERQKKRRSAAPSPASSESTNSSAAASDETGGSHPLSKKIRIKKKDSDFRSEYCQVVLSMQHHQQHGSDEEQQHAVETQHKKRSLFDVLNEKIPGGLPDEWARAVLQRSDRVRGDSHQDERGHHHHHRDVPLNVAPAVAALVVPKEVIKIEQQGTNEEISKDRERDAKTDDDEDEHKLLTNRSTSAAHRSSPRKYAPTPMVGAAATIPAATLCPHLGGEILKGAEKHDALKNVRILPKAVKECNGSNFMFSKDAPECVVSRPRAGVSVEYRGKGENDEKPSEMIKSPSASRISRSNDNTSGEPHPAAPRSIDKYPPISIHNTDPKCRDAKKKSVIKKKLSYGEFWTRASRAGTSVRTPGPQKGGAPSEEEERGPIAISHSPGGRVGDDMRVPLVTMVEERKNPIDEGQDITVPSSAAARAIGNDNFATKENPRREEANPMMINHSSEGKKNENTNTDRNTNNEEYATANGDITIANTPENTTITSRKESTPDTSDACGAGNDNLRTKEDPRWEEANQMTMKRAGEGKRNENYTNTNNEEYVSGDITIVNSPGNATITSRIDNTPDTSDATTEQPQYSPAKKNQSCPETDEENHSPKSELHKKMHALLDQVHGRVDENGNDDEEEGIDEDGKVGKNQSSDTDGSSERRESTSRKVENAPNRNKQHSMKKYGDKVTEAGEENRERSEVSARTSSSRRDSRPLKHTRPHQSRRVRSESRSHERSVDTARSHRRASFASSSKSSTTRDSRSQHQARHLTTRPRRRRRRRSRSYSSSSYSDRRSKTSTCSSRSRSRSNRRSSESSSSESESSLNLGARQEARKARRAKFVNWDKKPHNVVVTDPVTSVHGIEDVHAGGRKSRDLFVTQLPLKGVALIPQLITFFNFMFARIPAYKEKYIFKDATPITRITMSPCDTYVFVGFLNDELASTALLFDNALFLGRPIKIRHTQGYIPSPLGPCPPLDVRSLRKQNFIGPEGEDMTPIIKKMRELYVGNIGPTVTSEMLHTLFTTGLEGTDVHKAHIGPPVEGVKLLDRFAFITFQSPAVATAAMEVFHNYVLEMSALRIRRPSGYMGDVIIDIMDSVGADMDLVTSQAKAQGIYAAAVFFRADSDK